MFNSPTESSLIVTRGLQKRRRVVTFVEDDAGRSSNMIVAATNSTPTPATPTPIIYRSRVKRLGEAPAPTPSTTPAEITEVCPETPKRVRRVRLYSQAVLDDEELHQRDDMVLWSSDSEDSLPLPEPLRKMPKLMIDRGRTSITEVSPTWSGVTASLETSGGSMSKLRNVMTELMDDLCTSQEQQHE